jgi:hypothetical protein
VTPDTVADAFEVPESSVVARGVALAVAAVVDFAR